MRAAWSDTTIRLLIGAGAVCSAAALISLMKHRNRKLRVAILWLTDSLRLDDNEAIQCILNTNADRLLVVRVWQHGCGSVPTAAAAFEAAALAALDKQLQAIGSRLHVLSPAQPVSRSDAAHVVAQLASQLAADIVVVDHALFETESLEPHIATKFHTGCHVVTTHSDNATLFSDAAARACLGRARSGGGKMLRWAAFLSAGMNAKAPSTRTADQVSSIPPPPELPATTMVSQVPLQWALARRWAARMLQEWAPISEEGARQRATQAGEAATRSADIGEFGRDDRGSSSGRGARPSRLSPFLRFGLISARRAAACGVRQRDLVWRDWTYLCWRLVPSLRRGDAVITPLNSSCQLQGGAAKIELLNSFRTMGWESEADAFHAWCVGRTGSRVVDAGMRQLWVEGWMPRWVRLLSACCLCEGLGLDWRLGRDWYAYALTDHDPAINEAMWQNAGLCGIDPFYRSLRWEAGAPSDGEEAEDASDAEVRTYLEKWLSVSLRWPPGPLREAAAKAPPSQTEVELLAQSRREKLRGVYRAASMIGKAGVHISQDGAVLGVGRRPLGEFRPGLLTRGSGVSSSRSTGRDEDPDRT